MKWKISPAKILLTLSRAQEWIDVRNVAPFLKTSVHCALLHSFSSLKFLNLLFLAVLSRLQSSLLSVHLFLPSPSNFPLTCFHAALWTVSLFSSDLMWFTLCVDDSHLTNVWSAVFSIAVVVLNQTKRYMVFILPWIEIYQNKLDIKIIWDTWFQILKWRLKICLKYCALLCNEYIIKLYPFE